MNAAALTSDLAEAVDTADIKVVTFKAVEPETELERIAKAHRLAIAKYQQRAADAGLAMKADLGKLEADQKAETERHEAEMAILAARMAETKAKAEKDMAADRKLVASCKAALTELGRA
jgi:hypothetical protein